MLNAQTDSQLPSQGALLPALSHSQQQQQQQQLALQPQQGATAGCRSPVQQQQQQKVAEQQAEPPPFTFKQLQEAARRDHRWLLLKTELIHQRLTGLQQQLQVRS
jgi:hypothetical protein